MEIEIKYSHKDLKNRCYECVYLGHFDMDSFWGQCVCPDNKRVIQRIRHIMDKCCSFKRDK